MVYQQTSTPEKQDRSITAAGLPPYSFARHPHLEERNGLLQLLRLAAHLFRGGG